MPHEFKTEIFDMARNLERMDARLRNKPVEFYHPDDITLTGLEETESGGMSISFIPPFEDFYECPGVLVSEENDTLTLQMPRQSVGDENAAVELSANIVKIGKAISYNVNLPHRFRKSFSVTNGDSKRDFRGDDVTDVTEVAPLPTRTRCGTYTLAIHSNCRDGGPRDLGIASGHAWLSLHKCDTGELLHTFGAWPDGHGAIREAGLNGPGSDAHTDFAGDITNMTVPHYSYQVCISDVLKRKLDQALARRYDWERTNNCATFATETFEEVTGIEIDADDWGGVDTPREIGESIYDLNGDRAQPNSQPAVATGP